MACSGSPCQSLKHLLQVQGLALKQIQTTWPFSIQPPWCPSLSPQLRIVFLQCSFREYIFRWFKLFSPVLKGWFMPSKPKVFLPQDELVSDTDGVSLALWQVRGSLVQWCASISQEISEDRRGREGAGGEQHREECVAQNYLVFLGFVTSCTTTKGTEAARAPSLWAARPHQWLHLAREAYLKQGEGWRLGCGQEESCLWATSSSVL